MGRSTIGHGQSKSYYPNMDSSGDDQRNVKMSEVDGLAQRSGKNLRGYFPKDQLEEVKRIEAEELQERQAEAMKKDPTLAATLHGNRPAKGAMMDKELMTEDAETVRRMEERKERKKGLGHSSGSSSME